MNFHIVEMLFVLFAIIEWIVQFDISFPRMSKLFIDI